MKINFNSLSQFSETAGEYFYLADRDKLIDNYSKICSIFNQYLDLPFVPFISVKTNPLGPFLHDLFILGAQPEVVSPAELDYILDNFDHFHQIIFNGPQKTSASIRKALQSSKTVIINIDNSTDLELINSLSIELNTSIPVGLRLNIPFNNKKSRFGLSLSASNVTILRDLISNSVIDIVSLHAHISDRDPSKYSSICQTFASAIESLSLYKPLSLNFGGGICSQMSPTLAESLGCQWYPFADYAISLVNSLHNYDLANKIPITSLFFEFGTCLFADTMQYITKVASVNNDLSIATVCGSRFHYSVRSNAIRPVRVFQDNPLPSFDKYTVVGSTCVEDDILATNVSLTTDSFLIIDNVGSYAVSFSPEFINPKPPILYLSNRYDQLVSRFNDFASYYLTL